MKFNFYIALRAAGSRVDRNKGIIYGVSLIQLGAVKGHGKLIDNRSLETVAACAKLYESGLKVKFNARTFNHGDGAILGNVPVETIEIKNGQVVGDLVVDPDYPWPEEVKYLYSLAERQPDTFGLSIDFNGTCEEIGGVQFMRCDEIYSVTVVDEPAANSTGLFRIGDETPNPNPNPPKTRMALAPEDKQEISGMISEATAPILQAIKEMKDGAPPSMDGMSAEQQKAEEMAAGVAESDSQEVKLRKISTYRKGLQAKPLHLVIAEASAAAVRGAAEAYSKTGGRPVNGTGGAPKEGEEGEGDTKKHPFWQRVEKLTENDTMSQREAIAFCQKKHPEEYTSYRAAQQQALARKG